MVGALANGHFYSLLLQFKCEIWKGQKKTFQLSSDLRESHSKQSEVSERKMNFADNLI